MKTQLLLTSTLAAVLFSQTLWAQSFTLSDTQQNTCYDEQGNVITCPTVGAPLAGQDAQYPGISPMYLDHGDGTVSDLVSGLMWQQSYLNLRTQYDAACDYCEDLMLAGHSNWRLPSIKELFSLADFRGELLLQGASTPYLDVNYFDFDYPSMPFAAQYWSIDKYVKGPIQANQIEGAFGFNFADGHIKAYETGYYWDGTPGVMAPGNFVRCVRGNPQAYGANNFQDNGDSTVTDLATQLTWQKRDDGSTRDWEGALSYCENLSLAGYDDWRLPDVKELQSIVDYQKVTFPAIDPIFAMTDPDSWYWTSTTHGDNKQYACYIAFGKAYSKQSSTATTYYDWHGAGAMRSDPKYGDPSDYTLASINAADSVRIQNCVRCVRGLGQVSANEQGSLQPDLQVYPNPSADWVYIQWDGATSASASHTLRIFDAMGRMVMSERMASPARSIRSAEIGPSGLYFVTIQDANQRIVARQRLVVK